MALVDSHCHIHFPQFADSLREVLEAAREREVAYMLCVAVSLEDFAAVLALAHREPNVFASVGVHPNHDEGAEPTVAGLVSRSQDPRVVAIGETGLDYYRTEGDHTRQQERFRRHIQAARVVGKPLIVHTRAAAADTVRLLAEEGADEVGGVMHCFSESLEVAQAAMALGFYISFSGIVTFRTADSLREVAARVPAERLLVETDCPYLAPVPYRGKMNQPAYVREVASKVAEVRGVPFDELASQTTANFFRLFKAAAAA